MARILPTPGMEQANEGLWVVHLGGAHEIELEIADQAVVVFDQLQVDGEALADHGIVKTLHQSLAVGLIDDFPGRLGEVALVMGVLNVGEEVAALADKVETSAQQIPGGGIQDAQVHRPGVEIDSAIVAVLTGVKSHPVPSCKRVSIRPQGYSTSSGRRRWPS
jgi:hypothetical protein